MKRYTVMLPVQNLALRYEVLMALRRGQWDGPLRNADFGKWAVSFDANARLRSVKELERTLNASGTQYWSTPTPRA